MPLLRFRVVSLAVVPNIQGDPMVQVVARAHEGDAFQPSGDIARPNPPPAVGVIDILVNEEYVQSRKLTLGALVDPNLNVLEE